MKFIGSQFSMLAIILAASVFTEGNEGAAQTAISSAITTPDKVDSRLGISEFKYGATSAETLQKIHGNLDRTHAFEAFVNTFQAGSRPCPARVGS